MVVGIVSSLDCLDTCPIYLGRVRVDRCGFPEGLTMNKRFEINCYWFRVYGLGIAGERTRVVDEHYYSFCVYHGKIFLGPLLIDFTFE